MKKRTSWVGPSSNGSGNISSDPSSEPPTKKEKTSSQFESERSNISEQRQPFGSEQKWKISDFIEVQEWQWREVGEISFQIREAAKHPAFNLSKDEWLGLYNLCVQLVRLVNGFEFNSSSNRLPGNNNPFTSVGGGTTDSLALNNYPNPMMGLMNGVPHHPSMIIPPGNSNGGGGVGVSSNGGSASSSSQNGSGPPVTRCCQMCFVTESPVWRTGPHGQKTLCNACGLYYSKRQRHLKLQKESKEKETKDKESSKDKSSNINSHKNNSSLSGPPPSPLDHSDPNK